MSKFLMGRRRFLFMAPAIIAASSLMPGHSIAHLIDDPNPYNFDGLDQYEALAKVIRHGGTISMEDVNGGSIDRVRNLIVGAQALSSGISIRTMDHILGSDRSLIYSSKQDARAFWYRHRHRKADEIYRLWTMRGEL